MKEIGRSLESAPPSVRHRGSHDGFRAGRDSRRTVRRGDRRGAQRRGGSAANPQPPLTASECHPFTAVNGELQVDGDVDFSFTAIRL